MLTYLQGTQLKILAMVSVISCGVLYFGWQIRHFTHLAGQYDSRTVITWEYIPILLLSYGVFSIRSRMSWVLRGATRSIRYYTALAAWLSILPAILVPFVVAALLRTLPVAWVPGRDPLDDQPMSTYLPWDFIASLVPLLLVCAAVGLMLEATLGKGFGCFGPPAMYLGIVVLQSYGFLGYLSGVPGVFEVVITWGGVIFAASSSVIGVLVFSFARGGCSGLLQRRL